MYVLKCVYINVCTEMSHPGLGCGGGPGHKISDSLSVVFSSNMILTFFDSIENFKIHDDIFFRCSGCVDATWQGNAYVS